MALEVSSNAMAAAWAPGEVKPRMTVATAAILASDGVGIKAARCIRVNATLKRKPTEIRHSALVLLENSIISSSSAPSPCYPPPVDVFPAHPCSRSRHLVDALRVVRHAGPPDR